MAELPRLDDLVRFAVNTRHDTYRVFDGYSANVRKVREHHKKINATLLSSIRLFSRKVPSAGNREMCAGRECQNHIPRLFKQWSYVTKDVPLRVAA